MTAPRKCSPQWGSCALLAGHVGPHHGYPENIEQIQEAAQRELRAELERTRAALRECMEACRANLVYAAVKDEQKLLAAFKRAEEVLRG